MARGVEGAQPHRADADLVAVGQGGVGDGVAGVRGDAVGRAVARRERGAAADVVVVDVGLEDGDEPAPELLEHRLMHIGAGLHKCCMPRLLERTLQCGADQHQRAHVAQNRAETCQRA